MSYDAVAWALRQPIEKSSAKFVLVAFASNAGDEMTAWPSVAALCDATAQDRKTVMANVARLVALGYLEDTGERKGVTRQVVVYRLKSPENGTVQQSQKRNSPKNGTVPNFPLNSTVFPHKESRFSREESQKRDTESVRTSQEPIKEPVKETREPAAALPDWLPAGAWAEWCKYRRAGKGKFTAHAQRLSIGTLESLRELGHDPAKVIDQSIERGWTGLFELKNTGPPRPPNKPSAADTFAGKTYTGTPIDDLPPEIRDAVRAELAAVGDG